MIRRSLLVFALLVAGYALFIRFLKPADLNTVQHQASGNRISAEEYVFAPDDPEATVIVGSSLAFRIALDSLPPHTSNLSFGGLTVYDGLELVRRSGKHPKRVVVETNMIFKEPDRAFLDALFQPGLYELRKAVPMLREENQPSGVLVGYLKRGMKEGDASAASQADSMEVSENLFNTNRAIFAQVPPDSVQTRYLDRLEAEVKALEAQGIDVVFLEVPISAELMASPLARRAREAIQVRFPHHPFLRNEATWRTADGLHLQWHNAQRYSRWLGAELRALDQDASTP
ncbi:MAG TPA: hypothetical protein PKJ19_13925 [Flavobacteriales bacterium]|nr:hypothetical protein [Flavobacteriales bacterium]HNU57999.1 hypothetical protein [Flavobacteriales bacterium]